MKSKLITSLFAKNMGGPCGKIEAITRKKIRASRHWRSRGKARMIRGLRLCYEYVVFYGSLAIFWISRLLWSLPAALLYHVLPRRLGEPFGSFMIMAGFRY